MTYHVQRKAAAGQLAKRRGIEVLSRISRW
jgi:hypothetical protein